MTNLKHGHTKEGIPPIYTTWVAMRQRCLNPAHTAYKYYGGRGIEICNEWESFETFYADMGDRPEGKSLDRINNNGNYCKENCRWATPKEQNNNRRKRYVTVGGMRLSIKEAALYIGISEEQVYNRLRSGRSLNLGKHKKI